MTTPSRLTSLLFVPCLYLVACGGDDNTIVDVADENGSFTTLVGALQTTGLDETLSGDGPFTVFAPTDAAFALLPPGTLESLDNDTLTDILTYHVASGSVDASTVVTLDQATTVNGADVKIAVVDGTVVLNGRVQVVTTDIEADNGIIHVIDAVLLPPTIDYPGDLVQAASGYPIFSTLVGALGDAGLVSALTDLTSNANEFTVFAPTNFAFDKLGVDLSTLSMADLSNILLYHVVSGSVPAADVVNLTSANTLQGSSVSIEVNGGRVILNESSAVTQTDVRASNGVIHVIDGVLTPPAM